MGTGDYLLEDDNVELPREAFEGRVGSSEINNEWIVAAGKDLQVAAMRHWFLSRYQDPQMETPWDGEEKQYIYVWGGPYDPNDVIQDRFSEQVPYEVMEELVASLIFEVGDEWAPIDYEVDYYDEYLASDITLRSDPYSHFRQRFEQMNMVITEGLNDPTKDLILQMLHGAVISSLEAYLNDTLAYWLSVENKVMVDFVSGNPDLKDRKLSLSEIFQKMDSLNEIVEKYLEEQIWHRLDKVKPMMEVSLGITLPDIKDIMKKDIFLRHDIIHRAGKDKEGNEIALPQAQVEETLTRIEAFVDEIEAELAKRFPIDDDRLSD